MDITRPVVAVTTLQCGICGTSWTPRYPRAPKRCPNHDCRSPYWHTNNGRKKKRRAA